MELTKEQSDAFAKIIKRGLEHYRTVPRSLGHFEDTNDSGIIGYVVWQDPEAHFTTNEGDTNQEFYVTEKGEVCVYLRKKFTNVNFRAKNWRSFCEPKQLGSEDGNKL